MELNRSTLGPGCYIDWGRVALENTSLMLLGPASRGDGRYQFSGTHGTSELRHGILLSWVVKVEVSNIAGETPASMDLFEVGVATLSSLKNVKPTRPVAAFNTHGAGVICRYRRRKNACLLKFVGGDSIQIPDIDQSGLQLKFTFDGRRSLTLRIKVLNSDIFWFFPLFYETEPLFPFFRVVNSNVCKRRVSLEIIQCERSE